MATTRGTDQLSEGFQSSRSSRTEMTLRHNMFKKSIMVLSHPDDEVLWFSSILEKVDEVVICYLGCRSKPDWAEGRRQSIAEHPIKHITCLGMDESEVFKGADWQNPVVTKYGIEIINKNLSYSRYRENYHILKKHLTGILPNFENVFTHNPWGEYGNEEHVQLYRVIRELRDNMNFNLWFSSYCSNQSSSLLFRYISGFDNCYATFRTNKDLAEEAMKLYKRHNCWTWYDDWEWFNEESFMKDKVSPAEMKRYGHIFPLNLIKFNYPGVPKEETRQSRVRTAPLRSYLGRILRKSGLRRKRIPESG